MSERRWTRWMVLVVGACVLALLVPGGGARAATPANVETLFLQKLNTARAGLSKPPLVMHAGLRTASQGWSSSMATTNILEHGNTAARVAGASPDPAEANGPPDDGFGAWCENVAWHSHPQTATDDVVAQTFYDLWFNSTAGHKECMLSLPPQHDFGATVAGMGVVYDTAHGKWWATLKIVQDITPPSSSAAWTRREEVSSTGVTGTWRLANATTASGGRFGWTQTAGSTVTFTFNGTDVRWIGARASRGGIAEVRIDGFLVGNVDQFSSTMVWQQVSFERTGLSPGSHTIEVRDTASKNPAADGNFTVVDAWEFR